mgnify:CR=1 FL=1
MLRLIDPAQKETSVKYYFAYTFLMFNFLFECYAQGSLDAHIHGAAELNIVLEGHELLIELESPSFNLVGFEHEPKSLDQHKLVENTIELLKDFRRIANISPKADCKSIDVSISTTMKGLGDGHNEHHEDEHQHSAKEIHSEFSATYSLRCDKPENLKSIQLELFSTFELMEEIVVQMIIQGKQGLAELNPDNPNLKL